MSLPLKTQRSILEHKGSWSDVITPLHAAGVVESTLRTAYQQAQNVTVEDPGHASLDQPLSKEEISRMRYAHSWSVPQAFESLGPRWGRGLSLYRALLPTNVRKEWDQIFSQYALSLLHTSTGVSSFLKALGDTSKKYGPSFSANWRYFVNLETLGGYREKLDLDQQVSELRNWACGDIEHTAPDVDGRWTEETFLQYLEEGIDTFLKASPCRDKFTPLTLEEYSRQPGLLMGNGATSSRRALSYTCKGQQFRFPRTKTTTFMQMTPDQLLALLVSYSPQRNTPIQKVETGKVRAVIKSDDHLYAQMSYISYFLEPLLNGHPHSTLFMTFNQRLRMWIDLASRTRLDSPKMPLDQSHFDWQVNFRMLRVVVTSIRKFLLPRVDEKVRSDVALILDLIEQELTDGLGTITAGNITLQITKGVMSGWRWTALIDTLVNAGELFAVRKAITTLGYPDPVRSYVAQGDDDQVELYDYGSSLMVTEMYKKMGFEVNPHKFFVDDSRDEFLRQVPTPQGVLGYPARAINSVLWRNPVSVDLPPSSATARQIVDGWNLLASRGCDQTTCHKHMLRDLSGRFALPKDALDDWVHTPVPMGGLGVKPYSMTPRCLREYADQYDWWFVNQPAAIDTWAASLAKANLPRSIAVSHAKERIATPSVARGSVSCRLVQAPQINLSGSLTQMPVTYPTAIHLSTSKLDPELHQSAIKWMVRHDLDPAILADADTVTVAARIRNSVSRKLYEYWLLDRLPGGPPTVWGWGKEVVAYVYNKYHRMAWSCLVSSFGRSGVRRFLGLLLKAEDLTYDALTRMTHMSG